jgi:DNA-binding GntR family transcriptional regulator
LSEAGLVLDSAQPAAGARPPRDGVMNEIRSRIVRRTYLPGQRLIERDLAQEFGVSRAMIRDALSLLAERRLITRTLNRGAEVARIGRAEILAIYEVREVVEGLVARLATERAPDGAWKDLVILFDRPAGKAVAAHDVDAYSGMLDRLSERMTALAGNPVLTDLQSGLADRIAVLSRRAFYLPGRLKQGLDGHRKVLAAMAGRRAGEAERRKRENLRAARESLLAFEDFVL